MSDPTNPDPRPGDFRVLEFGLAPLQDIDPAALLSGNDDVDGFVLAMALAYNDIKSVQWMHFMLEKNPPPDTGGISADAGQWHGMKVQGARWLMALAHEILYTIARAHEKKTLNKAPIRKALASVPNRHRTLWKELVAVATKSHGKGVTLRPYLRDLRNDGVFHYAYHEKLLQGYKDRFLADAKDTHNERAYFSVGPTLKATRYYFADAAVQRMYTGNTELQERFNETEDFLQELHHTLSGFVWGYIRDRRAKGRP